jgi:hypothetical protein
MRKSNPILSLLIVPAALIILAAGCVTSNPTHATDPTAPAYVADTATISNTTATVQGVIGATSPVNPFALPLSGAAEAAGALITALSVLIASIKSKQASKQTAAADTLAEAVAKLGQPAVTKALQLAGVNSTSAEVAVHLDNNTQTP